MGSPSIKLLEKLFHEEWSFDAHNDFYITFTDCSRGQMITDALDKSKIPYSVMAIPGQYIVLTSDAVKQLHGLSKAEKTKILQETERPNISR